VSRFETRRSKRRRTSATPRQLGGELGVGHSLALRDPAGHESTRTSSIRLLRDLRAQCVELLASSTIRRQLPTEPAARPFALSAATSFGE